MKSVGNHTATIGDYRTVDFEYRGLVRLRATDATSDEIERLAKRFGQPTATGDEPVDITVKFCDKLAPRDLVYVGLNEAAFNDEGFYILNPVNGKVEAQIPFDQLGYNCTITYARHAKKCPLLFETVRLTLLRKEFIPLHASAFEYLGNACLVMGWAYGGKTESLFAFARRNARYLGDEWVMLSRDGSQMFGIPTSLTIPDWQFPQLGSLLPKVSWTRRIFFRAVGLLDAAHGFFARSRWKSTFLMKLLDRGLPRLRRRRIVKADPRAVFPNVDFDATTTPQAVFLIQNHERPETRVDPIEPAEMADRMVYSLDYERSELRAYYAAFRFSFPDLRNDLLDSAAQREQEMLREALAEKETFLVSHPYPVDFEQLFEQMEPHCRPAAKDHRAVSTPLLSHKSARRWADESGRDVTA